jgi:hypothetical protein
LGNFVLKKSLSSPRMGKNIYKTIKRRMQPAINHLRGHMLGALILVMMIIVVMVVAAAKRPEDESNIRQWGPLKENVICPHCQKKGFVHAKELKQNKGISGGKATAALLTGGVSLLATGLSRKEVCLQAHCMNCDMTWTL